MKEDPLTRERQQPTFTSRVFSTERTDEDRGNSRNRKEDYWKSTVFDGPIQERLRRKNLGSKNDHGTDAIFGQDKLDYGKSNNHGLMTQRNNGK